MIGTIQNITLVQINEFSFYIVQILLFYLCFKNIQHPLGAIHTGYGTDKSL